MVKMNVPPSVNSLRTEKVKVCICLYTILSPFSERTYCKIIYIYIYNGHRDGRYFKNLAQPVGSMSQWTAVQYIVLTRKRHIGYIAKWNRGNRCIAYSQTKG